MSTFTLSPRRESMSIPLLSSSTRSCILKAYISEQGNFECTCHGVRTLRVTGDTKSRTFNTSSQTFHSCYTFNPQLTQSGPAGDLTLHLQVAFKHHPPTQFGEQIPNLETKPRDRKVPAIVKFESFCSARSSTYLKRNFS